MNLHRPSFHRYFMDIAAHASTRSADPRTRVGAVAVDSDNSIIVTGYNGMPVGIVDSPKVWSCKDELVIHAEENLVAFAAKQGRVLRGATVYSTHIPCKRCTRLLLQCGVKTFIYTQDNTTGYQGTWVADHWPTIWYMVRTAGVDLWRLTVDDELEHSSCEFPAGYVGPELPEEAGAALPNLARVKTSRL